MNLGTIEELPSGKVSARLPRSVDPKRRRLGPFNSREEAEGVVNASLEMAQQGQLAVPEGQTLRGLLPAFLERRELRGLRDTGNTRNLAKNHIEDALFVDWPLKNIQHVHVQDWLDRVQRKRARGRKTRLGIQSVLNILNLLRALFAEALRRKLIATNPAREVALERAAYARSDDPWTYLTVVEQAALLAVVPPEERPLVTFATWTGVRKSELWQLRLVDVHVEGDDPHVVVRYSRKGRPTKNGKVHKVPLLGAAFDAAKEQLRLLKGKRNHKRVLFPSPHGEIRDKAPRDWKKWLKAARIARRVRWHDLRHTAFTSLLCGWRGGRKWSMEEVQKYAGHLDQKSTLRYAHFADEALREAVAETEAAIRARKSADAVSTGGSNAANVGPSSVAETIAIPTAQAATVAAAKAVDVPAAEAVARSGPHLVQNESQVLESVTQPDEFLNRRSQVRLLSGAPNDFEKLASVTVTSQ